jgi:hypothetical protein
MKSKAFVISETEEKPAGFSSFFRESLRELAAIHRANRSDDVEIRKLQSSTRKKLDRIRENLGLCSNNSVN